MVLAAGRGERLRPMTDSCPKPMIPVAGKPLLEYVIRLLARHGFDQIVINLWHLPDQVSSYFGDGRKFGVTLTYSIEEELLGTAGAVGRMRSFFDQPFLIYYGDHLANVDLTDLWNAHTLYRGLATIGLIKSKDPASSGIVEVETDDRIRQFVEKPSPGQVFEDYLVNAGIYVAEPTITDWIPTESPSDFGHHVFPALLRNDQPMFGHSLRGQLLALDTLERYTRAVEIATSSQFSLP